MGDEFKTDVQAAVDSGGLKIFDKERLEIASDPARITALIDKATRDIITEGGSATAFSGEMRTLNFEQGQAGFDAFMALQTKYGAGQDILTTLTGHLSSMAQESALVEMLGPQHASTVAVLAKNARDTTRLGGVSRPRPSRLLGQESASSIERTYAVLNGQANGVENAMWGGILGSARSLMTASSLGSAVVPATIGDSVTTLLASRGVGIDGVKVLQRAVEIIASESPTAQADAARLLVTGHAMSDHAISASRYADQQFTPELVKRTADFVIRASGLAAWTEGLKKAFTMEFLGYIAKVSGKTIDDVDAPFRAFLDRYKIGAADWDALRARPLHDFRGATFFDSSQAADDPLVRKLYEGILQERAMAVLEPDARVRAVTTQGARSGTFLGEVARSATMFQSFAMTMVNTHMTATAIRDGVAGNRGLNNVLFYGSHIIAGAAIIQARQILQGKDPIDIHNPKFWAQAALQGGGRDAAADRSVAARYTGPIGSLIDDAAQFGHAVVTGKPGAAAKGVALLKHITPGSNLWFSRWVTDRLIFDQLQRMLDPNYAQSFARKEQQALKAYGQQYWWHPGDTRPERAPRATAAIGQ